MKPKDYIDKKAKEEALKAFGATQLNNNQETSPYFVGKISADRKKITDPTGKEYDLIFTGNPKQYELAQRLSDKKAVVNAQVGAKMNVDGNLPVAYGISFENRVQSTQEVYEYNINSGEVQVGFFSPINIWDGDVVITDYVSGLNTTIMNTSELTIDNLTQLDVGTIPDAFFQNVYKNVTLPAMCTLSQDGKNLLVYVLGYALDNTDLAYNISGEVCTAFFPPEGPPPICICGSYFVNFYYTRAKGVISYRYYKNIKLTVKDEELIFSYDQLVENQNVTFVRGRELPDLYSHSTFFAPPPYTGTGVQGVINVTKNYTRFTIPNNEFRHSIIEEDKLYILLRTRVGTANSPVAVVSVTGVDCPYSGTDTYGGIVDTIDVDPGAPQAIPVVLDLINGTAEVREPYPLLNLFDGIIDSFELYGLSSDPVTVSYNVYQMGYRIKNRTLYTLINWAFTLSGSLGEVGRLTSFGLDNENLQALGTKVVLDVENDEEAPSTLNNEALILLDLQNNRAYDRSVIEDWDQVAMPYYINGYLNLGAISSFGSLQYPASVYKSDSRHFILANTSNPQDYLSSSNPPQDRQLNIYLVTRKEVGRYKVKTKPYVQYSTTGAHIFDTFPNAVFVN